MKCSRCSIDYYTQNIHLNSKLRWISSGGIILDFSPCCVQRLQHFNGKHTLRISEKYWKFRMGAIQRNLDSKGWIAKSYILKRILGVFFYGYSSDSLQVCSGLFSHVAKYLYGLSILCGSQDSRLAVQKIIFTKS